MPKRRVLFVASQLPFPLTSGGRIRNYHLMKALAATYDVGLVAYGADGAPGLAELRGLVGTLEVVPGPAPGGPQWQRALDAACAFSSRPVVIARYDRPAMRRRLERVRSQGYDATVYASLHMGSLWQGLGLELLDTHNVQSVIWARLLAQTRGLVRRAVVWDQFRKMRRYEAALVARFGACLVTSETDGRYLRELNPVARVLTVPNGVDCEYYRCTDPGLPPRRQVVFVGSLDWRPNADAVRELCVDIWPRVVAKVPDASLVIVGANPPPAIRALETRSVSVVGQVDDVRPWIASSRVLVVPIRWGSGTRIKILEAMAMGRPVVSTTVGAEGIDAVAGEEILIADDPAAFAEQVVAVLVDDALLGSIGQRGRRRVECRYDWRVVTQPLLEFLSARLG